MSEKLNLIMGAKNGAKSEREQNDFYATSPDTVEMLLKQLSKDNLILNHNIWECACGAGHISKVLLKHGYNVLSSDIVNRYVLCVPHDFLKVKPGDFPLINTDILTNPPYKEAEQFILHALDLIEPGCKVIMYLKIQFLEGIRRFNSIYKNYPPKYVYIHSTRQSVAKDGDFEKHCKSSNTVCYIWAIWEKGNTNEPVLRWIAG